MASGSVLDILECPVCLSNATEAPIFQCIANGHIVCKDCKKKIDKECPICRDKKGFSRCRAAEKLLDHCNSDGVPTINNQITRAVIQTPKECPNKRAGCKAINSPQHTIECVFRQVNCPDVTCGFIGPARCMVRDHVTSNHNHMVIRSTSFETPMVFRLSIKKEHWEVATSYKPIRFSAFGFNFFRTIRRSPTHQAWHFWVYFDGNNSQSKEVIVDLSIRDDSRELTFKHNPVPLDFSADEVMEDCRGLKLSDDFMKTFVRKEEAILAVNVKRMTSR